MKFFNMVEHLGLIFPKLNRVVGKRQLIHFDGLQTKQWILKINSIKYLLNIFIRHLINLLGYFKINVQWIMGNIHVINIQMLPKGGKRQQILYIPFSSLFTLGDKLVFLILYPNDNPAESYFLVFH